MKHRDLAIKLSQEYWAKCNNYVNTTLSHTEERAMFNKLERLMSINGNSYVTVFRSEHFEIHRFWHQDYTDCNKLVCTGVSLASALMELTSSETKDEDGIVAELDAFLREGYDLSMFANMSNSFSVIIAPAGAKAGELSANKSLREALREAVIKHRHNAEEK